MMLRRSVKVRSAAALCLCLVLGLTVFHSDIMTVNAEGNEPVKNAWNKVDGKYYFYDANGVVKKSTIAGNSQGGYYYVGADGVRVDTTEMNLAVTFVRKHSKMTDSRRKRLKQCYTYLWKHYRYKDFHTKVTPARIPGFARYMLRYKRGDCSRYAASLAYIAKAIGYDTYMSNGLVSSIYGGMTAHSWTEVRVGKKKYICDANMQMHHPKKNSFMKTYKKYPYRLKRNKRFRMTATDGVIRWK